MWSYAYAFFMPSSTNNNSDRRLLEQQQGDLEKYTNHMHSQVNDFTTAAVSAFAVLSTSRL
jgi:hypothetical protein